MFTRRTAYLALGILGFLAYFNALANGFVWDDEFLVRNNSYIRNHTYLAKAFVTELHHGELDGNFYRPLLTASFMLDYFFGGLNPLGYHLTNVVLHLLCALLVYELTRSLLRRFDATVNPALCGINSPSQATHFGVLALRSSEALALAVAAVFLVHPINTEAVTYISGRTDPMVTIFLLGSLLLFMSAESSTQPRWQFAAYGLSLVSFGGALLSRETALIFPVIILWYGFAFLRRNSNSSRRWWAITLPFFAMTVLFWAWRTYVFWLVHAGTHENSFSFAQKLVFFVRALAEYVGLLFFPAHLQMERQVIAGDWSLWLMTLLGALVVYGWIFMMIVSHRRWPILFFGLGWFAIGLLPVSGLFDVNATMAEHWLYFPSIGFYLAVAWTIQQWLVRRGGRHEWLGRCISESSPPWMSRTIGLATLLVISLLTVRTIFRNEDWRDASTFYQRTLEVAPFSPRMQNNLANQQVVEGDFSGAIAKLEQALRVAGGGSLRSTILANLGLAYMKAKNLDRARDYLQQAVALSPKNPIIYFNLSLLDENLGRVEEAERELRQAVQACPQRVSAYANLAYFLLKHKRWSETRQTLGEALKLEPGQALLHNLMGAAFSSENNFSEALKSFQRAVALDQHSPDALINLGLLHSAQGRLDLAEHTLQRAICVAPDNPQPHFRLGLFYWQQKNWAQASQELKRARDLALKDPLIQLAADQVSRRQEFSAATAVSPALEQENSPSRLPPALTTQALPAP